MIRYIEIETIIGIFHIEASLLCDDVQAYYTGEPLRDETLAASEVTVDIMASSMSDKEDGDWVDGAVEATAAAEYDFVRFTLSDMHGIARSKLIPRRHVVDSLKTGIGLCPRKLLLVAFVIAALVPPYRVT